MKQKIAHVVEIKAKLKQAFAEQIDENRERINDLKGKVERLEQISILSH